MSPACWNCPRCSGECTWQPSMWTRWSAYARRYHSQFRWSDWRVCERNPPLAADRRVTIGEDPCPGLDVLFDQQDQDGGRMISNMHQKAPFRIVSFDPTEDCGTIHLWASIIFAFAELRFVYFHDVAWASDGLGLALHNSYADLPWKDQPVDEGIQDQICNSRRMNVGGAR